MPWILTVIREWLWCWCMFMKERVLVKFTRTHTHNIARPTPDEIVWPDSKPLWRLHSQPRWPPRSEKARDGGRHSRDGHSHQHAHRPRSLIFKVIPRPPVQEFRRESRSL